MPRITGTIGSAAGLHIGLTRAGNGEKGVNVPDNVQRAAEIPEQQTIEEALTTEGEPNADPTSEDSAGTSSEDAPGPAAEAAPTGNGGPRELDPTIVAGAESLTADSLTSDSGPEATTEAKSSTPQEHRFRITHETSNPGAPSPHSVRTSAAMLLEDVAPYLAELAAKFL